MMKVLILVCAAAMARSDCGANTARIIVEGPEATNAISCARRSQAYFAESSLEIGKDEYIKIVCARQATVKADLD